MMRSVLLLSGLLGTALAMAGSATGRIATIEITNHLPAILFTLDAEIQGTPRCNEYERFAVDLRKIAGDEVYEALLLARREGYVVRVEGLNTCAADWKSEDVKSITLQ